MQPYLSIYLGKRKPIHLMASVEKSYVANATLLANMSALFVIPLGWLFFGRQVKLLFIIYALCSFSGVALLLSVSMADLSLLLILASGSLFI